LTEHLVFAAKRLCAHGEVDSQDRWLSCH